MIRLPRDPIDATLLATFAGATGPDRLARATVPGGEIVAAAPGTRFIDQAGATFTWSGAEVYLTPTDTIALASGAILLVRFLLGRLRP